jgi:hypothetical protein
MIENIFKGGGMLIWVRLKMEEQKQRQKVFSTTSNYFCKKMLRYIYTCTFTFQFCVAFSHSYLLCCMIMMLFWSPHGRGKLIRSEIQNRTAKIRRVNETLLPTSILAGKCKKPVLMTRVLNVITLEKFLTNL